MGGLRHALEGMCYSGAIPARIFECWAQPTTRDVAIIGLHIDGRKDQAPLSDGEKEDACVVQIGSQVSRAGPIPRP
jgi:hypothetical protein